MSIQYTMPGCDTQGWCPRSVRLADGRVVTGVTPETFADLPGCSVIEVPDPAPVDWYPAWRDEHRDGLMAFRAVWDKAMGAMVATGTTLPERTFRSLKAKCRELGGDWLTRYRDVRDMYDEVVFAAGTLAQAADILPLVLADKTLGGQA